MDVRPNLVASNSGSSILAASLTLSSDDGARLSASSRELQLPRANFSQDLGTSSQVSAMSRCETDPELKKMGRAMTIKVAAAESDPSTPLGGADCLDEDEEAVSRWEKEVRLPGRPLSHDGLLTAGDSPMNQPATLSPSADSACRRVRIEASLRS